MNPNIILAGQAPNVMNALAQGIQTGQQANQFRRENALAAAMQQHGAQAAQGDQAAMNALTGFDYRIPLSIGESRLGMEATRHGMAATDRQLAQADQRIAQGSRQLDQADARIAQDGHRLELLTAQERRAATEYARGLDAQTASAEAAELDQTVRMLYGAQSSEQWDRIAQERGTPQYAGRFEDREPLLNSILEAKDILEANSGGTEAEAEIARLVGIGIPYDVAVKIKEGVFSTVTDPVTRETMVVDLGTGQNVFRVGATEQNGAGGTPAAGPQGPVAQQGQSSPITGGPAPSGQGPDPLAQSQQVQSPAPQLSYGEQYAAANDAFGAAGYGRRVANTIADTVGADLPFPNAASTQADFAVLREQLLNDISGGYARQSPSWLLENIQRLIPEAGRFFEGSGHAKNQLRALGHSVNSEIGATRQQLDEGRLSPTRRGELEQQLAGLINAQTRINGALGAFEQDQTGGGSTGSQTSTGIRWSINP